MRLRQFECEKCDSVWWKKQEFSVCRECNTEYEAIPEEKEWGWAIFNCTCSNQFSGFGGWEIKSPCYQCNAKVSPSEIRPPRRRKDKNTESRHCCDGDNCYNRDEHPDGSRDRKWCCHPRSNTGGTNKKAKKRVRFGSKPRNG